MSTIKDVAKLAGVSTSTVSRALSGRVFVEEDTRRRVLQAVEQLGYQPNILARGLKQGRTYTLAFLVPDINSLFYPQIMKAVERAAAAEGYSILLCNNDESVEQERRTVERLAARGIDGIICMAVADQAAHLEALQSKQGVPVVLVNRSLPAGLSSISVDNEAGGYATTCYLLQRGHRRIAGLFGNFERQRFRERYAGCKRAMQEWAVPDYKRLFVYDVNTAEQAYRRALELLCLPPAQRPTAFFASMDILAIGIYRAVNERGLRVPEDISVVGFDNIELSQYILPPLTTYTVPIQELAQRSVAALLAQMERPGPPVHEILPGALVERQSVKALPPGA